jgi:hypothetical protein
MPNSLKEPLSAHWLPDRAPAGPGVEKTDKAANWFPRLGAADFAQEIGDLALHLGRPVGQPGHRA